MITPLYGQLSPLRIPMAGLSAAKKIAADYIAAVEAADGQSLESAVKTAYENFISGLVNDGLWLALKSSCVLAGARTLSGALVPLIGSAPTNNNFVSADYNRKTGFKGNGSTKFLNTNRPNNSDPQNSKHISIFQTERCTGANIAAIGVMVASPSNRTQILFSDSNNTIRVNNSINTATSVGGGTTSGFKGGSRFSSNQWVSYRTGNSLTQSVVSSDPGNINTYVFANNSNGAASSYYNGRLAFYSIGENIDLALLDTRVSNLMTALAAAIP